MLRIVYLVPTSELHGGIRVPINHAEGLAARGWDAEIWAPDPPPSWHPLRVGWRQVAFEPELDLTDVDVAVATFYSTVPLAAASGARLAVHLCQGYEGVHREYAPILDQIEAAYRLSLPKLVVSQHLASLLGERFGARCHYIGQAVDTALFHPPAAKQSARLPTPAQPLRIGLVGSYSVRPKGIPEALDALVLARAGGVPLTVYRASIEPQSDAERALGLISRYLERAPTEAMPAFYRDLDLLLFSSWDEEGFGLPVLEAMACQVPVLATDIAPLRALPDDALVRVPCHQPELMAAAVETLARAPLRREQLALRGFRAAESMPLSAVIDRLEEAFAREGVARTPGRYTQPR